jgi:hypothetical protein
MNIKRISYLTSKLRLKIWHKKSLIIACAIVLVSGLAISSNLVGRSYTSDDVAHQAIAYNFTQSGKHTFGESNESFILKLPIYFIFNTLTNPGRAQLLWESLLFNAVMVCLLVIWWRKSITKPSNWLVFTWLMADGLYWMLQTVNPNTRNLEIGLMLLFSWYVINKIISPPSDKRAVLLCVAGSGLVAGVLIYNDPYFLFYVLLPLFVAVFIYCIWRKTIYPALAAGCTLLIGLVVNTSLGEILKHLGLSAGGSNLANLVATTTVPGDLLRKTIQVLNSYLSLMGASQPGMWSSFRILLETALNFGVVCLAIFGLYSLIKKRKFSLLNIWMLVTIVISMGYAILSGLSVFYTVRYLIILVPLTALLVVYALQHLSSRSRKYYRLALIFIGLSLSINIIQSVITINQKRYLQPNLLDYKIVASLEKNDVAKSYGNDWVANISYYLSDYKSNVLPTVCFQGNVYPDLTLVEVQRFSLYSTKTGIIVSPKLVIPTRSPFPPSPSCTVWATIKQFGAPQK